VKYSFWEAWCGFLSLTLCGNLYFQATKALRHEGAQSNRIDFLALSFDIGKWIVIVAFAFCLVEEGGIEEIYNCLAMRSAV